MHEARGFFLKPTGLDPGATLSLSGVLGPEPYTPFLVTLRQPADPEGVRALPWFRV